MKGLIDETLDSGRAFILRYYKLKYIDAIYVYMPILMRKDKSTTISAIPRTLRICRPKNEFFKFQYYVKIGLISLNQNEKC